MAPDYSDLARPSLRAGSLVAALCSPAGPLSRLDVLDDVGSTNAWLLERASRALEEHPHLSVVLAEHQSAGRGRLGRTWTAPPRSGLFASVLLRPDGVPRERWSWLPLLAGASVAAVLRRTAGLEASVKWPNDVLVGAPGAQTAPTTALGKVAGVLTEVLPGGDGVVVGIGINVSLSAAELPVPTATSLLLAGAASTDRDVLARSMLRQVARDVRAWADAGGDAEACGLAARVREACSTLGCEVRVELPGGSTLEGVAEAIDADGRLLVRPGRPGERDAVAVGAGDVVHLRRSTDVPGQQSHQHR